VAFDRQPVLTGQLLLLRPLGKDDFEALYRIASDPAVWEQHPSKDRKQEPVFRDWFEQALASGGALVAVDHCDGSVIGTSRYVVRGEDEVEIGWTFLARARWGGLWNGEMKRLMLDHAFASVSAVVFTVHSDNVRSQRAVERLGAVRVGIEVDAHGRGTNIFFRLSGAMT
jgi:RimJ/RimL family protein N-acetyltransferase